jgi:hypothetical protein
MHHQKVILVAVCLIFHLSDATAQPAQLSARQLQKLNEISNGRDRIHRFTKYLRRDSVRRDKRLRKKFRQRVDSTALANNSLDFVRKKFRKLKGGNPATLERFGQEQSAMALMDKLPFENLPDFPSRTESIPEGLDLNAVSMRYLPHNIPSLHSIASKPHSFLPGDQADLIENVPLDPASISSLPDTLSTASMSQHAGELLSTHKHEQIERAGAMLRNSDTFSAAQTKVSKLLSKYRKFSDSENLQDAIPQRSLSEKHFTERLVISCSVLPVSFRPLQVDLAPQIGYKLNRDFHVGFTPAFRFSYSDTTMRGRSFALRSHAYGIFVRHNIYKTLFAFGSVEKSNSFAKHGDRHSTRTCIPSLGLGTRFVVHPRLYLNVLAVYNFSDEAANKVALSRIRLSVGVELSSLSLRKPGAVFHPNRH